MKRHAFVARPLKRRRAMRDLLEADAKSAADDVEIVSLRPRRFDECAVRHEHGAREIICERDARESLCLGAREVRILG